MAHLNNTETVSKSVTSKPMTKVERWKEKDGTYEVTFIESKRRKLTTEDELLPEIAQLANAATMAVRDRSYLLIGETDVHLAFAHRFLQYLKDDSALFKQFLADTQGNDMVVTSSKPPQTHTKSVQTAPDQAEGEA